MAARFARLAKFGPELAGLAALALVVLLQLADTAPLERVRLQVFDFFQDAAPREIVAEERVAVVDIDEESIARLGQWPWPRTELAELNRRLGEAGAAVVAYDIVFSEPDRTSPAEIAARYEQMGRGAELGGAFAGLPSHDALFVGDAFATKAVTTGEEGPRVAPFTADADEAVRSLARFEGLEARWVLPGHGQAWTGGVAEAVRLVRERSKEKRA